LFDGAAILVIKHRLHPLLATQQATALIRDFELYDGLCLGKYSSLRVFGYVFVNSENYPPPIF